MSEWLELELARELRPVTAPVGLWGRVQAGRRPQATQNRWRTLRLAAVALMMVLIAAGTFWTGRRGADLESLAARELNHSANLELHSGLELRSGDAVEIAAWLRREAGLEVAIPVSARVQLEGARLIRARGALIGEVAYRVGDDSALLLVARAGGAFRAAAKHGGFSWQKQEQVYAIASTRPDQRRAACALCHTL